MIVLHNSLIEKNEFFTITSSARTKGKMAYDFLFIFVKTKDTMRIKMRIFLVRTFRVLRRKRNKRNKRNKRVVKRLNTEEWNLPS